jgi:hypothetical protein
MKQIYTIIRVKVTHSLNTVLYMKSADFDYKKLYRYYASHSFFIDNEASMNTTLNDDDTFERLFTSLKLKYRKVDNWYETNIT